MNYEFQIVSVKTWLSRETRMDPLVNDVYVSLFMSDSLDQLLKKVSVWMSEMGITLGDFYDTVFLLDNASATYSVAIERQDGAGLSASEMIKIRRVMMAHDG